MLRFENSYEAGELLALSLAQYHDQPNTVVVALSESATEIAFRVASSLDLPFIAILPMTRFGSELTGRSVIVVAHGFATADEVRDAAATVLLYQPARFIVATPVISAEAHRVAEKIADSCVYVAMPSPFQSVGFWYDDALRTAARALFVGTGQVDRRAALRN